MNIKVCIVLLTIMQTTFFIKSADLGSMNISQLKWVESQRKNSPILFALLTCHLRTVQEARDAVNKDHSVENWGHRVLRVKVAYNEYQMPNEVYLVFKHFKTIDPDSTRVFEQGWFHLALPQLEAYLENKGPACEELHRLFLEKQTKAVDKARQAAEEMKRKEKEERRALLESLSKS